MFTEKELENYADVLLWGLKTARTKRFKKGDIIFINFESPAIKLAEIVYAKVLEWGMNPVSNMMHTPKMQRNFYNLSNNKQLKFIAPWAKLRDKSANGDIYIHAPTSLTHLKDVDNKKMAKRALAVKPLHEIIDKKGEKGEHGWTLCSYPTEKLAEHAGFSLEEYTNEIRKGCYLDKDDPVAEWKKTYKDAQKVKKWLNGLKNIKYLHIESENMDLQITPGKERKWVGISGHNIPSFEIFLSPDWRGTEGKYYANQKSYKAGNEVKNVEIQFSKGRAVEITAEKGEKFTINHLNTDKGASQVGEFSLTDKRFSKINRYMAEILYDENYGGEYGNCHIALGDSYTETYDGNPSKLTPQMKKKLGFNDSAIHWDLINSENKKVTAHFESGKELVIYENGIFKY